MGSYEKRKTYSKDIYLRYNRTHVSESSCKKLAMSNVFWKALAPIGSNYTIQVFLTLLSKFVHFLNI